MIQILDLLDRLFWFSIFCQLQHIFSKPIMLFIDIIDKVNKLRAILSSLLIVVEFNIDFWILFNETFIQELILDRLQLWSYLFKHLLLFGILCKQWSHLCHLVESWCSRRYLGGVDQFKLFISDGLLDGFGFLHWSWSWTSLVCRLAFCSLQAASYIVGEASFFGLIGWWSRKASRWRLLHALWHTLRQIQVLGDHAGT